jgi:DNA-binding transcriptional MocR family regulator
MTSPQPGSSTPYNNGHAADVVVAEEKAAYGSWRPMMPPDLYSPEIGVIAIAVYGVLAIHVDGKTGECDPSHPTIAKRLGVSRDSVIRAIAVLVEKGFVERTHRALSDGAQTTNLYCLPHQKHTNVQGLLKQTGGLLRKTGGVAEIDGGGSSDRHEPYVIKPPVKESSLRSPKNFVLTVEDYDWAATNIGASRQECDFGYEEMIDWAAQKGTMKKDWRAAWRNWMRRRLDDGKIKANGNAPAHVETEEEHRSRLRAEFKRGL